VATRISCRTRTPHFAPVYPGRERLLRIMVKDDAIGRAISNCWRAKSSPCLPAASTRICKPSFWACVGAGLAVRRSCSSSAIARRLRPLPRRLPSRRQAPE
jgi:hypothetical protein